MSKLMQEAREVREASDGSIQWLVDLTSDEALQIINDDGFCANDLILSLAKIEGLEVSLTIQTEAKEMFNRFSAERGKRIEELEAIVCEQKRCVQEYQAKLKRVLAEVEEWHLNDKNPWDTLTAIKDIMEELILQSHEAIK